METKTVYQYDFAGYFVQNLTLDNTDKSPSGAWNIPAYCTDVEPLAVKDGYNRKFNGAWEYEEIPKEPEPIPPTIEELKSKKLAEIDAWTAEHITGGFTSSCTGVAVKYDSDKDTQITVSSDLNAISLAPDKFAQYFPDGYPMRGYNANAIEKTVFYLTIDQLIQWNVDLALHRGACKQQGWDKQALVNNATTKEELDAITLD